MGSYHIREICLHMRCDFASCKYTERYDKIIQVTSYGISSNRANSKVGNYGEYAAVEGGEGEQDLENSNISERWRCKVEKVGGGGWKAGNENRIGAV